MRDNLSLEQGSVGSLSMSCSSHRSFIWFDERCTEDTGLGYIISVLLSLRLQVRTASSQWRKPHHDPP